MRLPSRAAVAALAVLLLWGASAASAAATSRDEFIAAAEPICKTNTEAADRILAKVRSEVKQDELKPAAIAFEAAAKALQATLGELKALSRPPADAARIKAWFADVEVELGLFKATAKKLRSGDRTGAERMSVKLTRAANRANDEALPFEFHYCRAEPSRFL